MDVDALINDLKDKVICEFKNLLRKIKLGHRPDYETLLEEISFIDIIENKDIEDSLHLTILQYYLNHNDKQ